jgi:hypothetical protein
MVSWCKRIRLPLVVGALLLYAHSAHAQVVDESFADIGVR